MARFRLTLVAIGLSWGAILWGGDTFLEFARLPVAQAAEQEKAIVAQAAETAAPQQAQGEPEYSKDGIAGCMDCHDETEEHPVYSIFKTSHAQMADSRTPFANNGCESCHGPSAAHSNKPRRFEVAVNFGPTKVSPPEVQNKTCLGCHEDSLRIHWRGSQHESADLPCVSCHNVHTVKDKVLVKQSQAAVCFTCHMTQKAQMLRFSRHPIREGKVACSDCHNPHGSIGPALLREVSVNDTCYTCHAEKRGPFLWEHAPVRDDCTTCHTPHGSSQPRLLKARGPFLCQQCHMAAFHPSTLYSGTGLPINTPASRLLVKNCLNCHPVIHGSNHPSGVRFTR